MLYNGETRWQAAQNLHELVEAVPGGLERYRPQLQYLLLDEEEGREEGRCEMARNLVRITALDDATITHFTGLSEADVQALREVSARANLTGFLETTVDQTNSLLREND